MHYITSTKYKSCPTGQEELVFVFGVLDVNRKQSRVSSFSRAYEYNKKSKETSSRSIDGRVNPFYYADEG